MNDCIVEALQEIVEKNYSRKIPENWNIQYSGNTKLNFKESDSVKSRVENILSHKDEVNLYGLNFTVDNQEHTIDES